MKVEIIYRTKLRRLFLTKNLPLALREAIDSTKYNLYELAVKTGKPKTDRTVHETFYPAGDHVYSVKYVWGEVRQESAKEEPIQQLQILQIIPVEGLHPIR